VLIGPELMPSTLDRVKIGEWTADARDDSISRGAERVKLEPRTMRLLLRLAQSPGVVVSLDELLESVWSGVVVGTASVYQSMSQLRKVLGDTDDPPRYIETVARKGYRLVASVSEPTAAEATVAAAAPAVPAPVLAPIPRRAGPRLWAALAVVAFIAVSLAVWRFWLTSPAPAGPPTVVVLPFLDLTDGKTEQNFCDGLTEETSNWLAQVPTLRVVASTSAFAYRNHETDARTIGRELQTTHMLEGSLRRSGEQMRITVQLIDTRTGLHVWSNSYDFERGNVLAMQEDIARKVADNLEIRITAQTDGRFAGRSSKSAEAQRLYLLATAHEQKMTNEANERAITLYKSALEADPQFVLAKVWLAHAIMERRFLDSQPIESLAPQIEPLLADAAREAPDLVDLYVVRGYFYTEMRQREPAIQDLRHALSLNPNSSGAAEKLGFYYLTAGQPREALTYYTLASSLDPKSEDLHGSRCTTLAELGEFTAAAAACERARALAPDSAWVYNISGKLERERGDLETASRWDEMALQRGDDLASVQGERVATLVTLGLIREAGASFQRARVANPAAARRHSALLFAGSIAAVDAGGIQGLRTFMRDNDLEHPTEPTQLFVLANAALIAGDAPLARQYVDGALGSNTLRPEDIASTWHAARGYSSLLVISAALRGSGEPAAAERRLAELSALLDRMVEGGVQTNGMYFVRAELEAMRGDADKAMAALQRAVQLGWRDAWLAEHQPYLESLRGRADFRALLATVNARNADTAARIRGKLAS